jgi:predicted nucleic acid-binding protein
MKFWDSSALVPLMVEQTRSRQMMALLKKDRQQIVWWGSQVECVSAVSRLELEGTFTLIQTEQALENMKTLANSWHEIHPSVVVRETAVRLLRTHPLRSADALQLAAAFHAAEGKSGSLEFVCLDDRLSAAAQREGFRLVL